MNIRSPEFQKFFVVRVILMQADNGTWRPVTIDDMDVPTQIAILAMVRRGDICKLPGGEFAEGVKEHRNEYAARLQRTQLAQRHPDEDFRVVMETGVLIP